MILLGAAPFGFSQKAARCDLSVTVYNSVTNSGIAHALVSYAGPASGFRFTDASGAFRVENLPAGEYELTASKPGYASDKELSPKVNPFDSMRGRPPVDPGDEVRVASKPGQTRASMELKPGSQPARVKLVPLSIISGTVLDENSEPLEGVSLQAVAIKAALTGTDYTPVQKANTDDRGHYRFLDLLPGDYIVRLAGEVSSTHMYMGSLNLNNDHRGMRPVYYPSGDSTASASVFHLAPAEHATADFQQPTEAAFDINGRLAGFTLQAWTQMQLYRDGDRLPVGRAFVNTSSGQFRVTDVPPGSYTLRAVQFGGEPPKYHAAETQVSILSEPIRNLVIELSGGADIPVSVSYEAGAQAGGMMNLSLQAQHMPGNARFLLIGKPPLPPDAQPAPVPEQPSVLTNVIPDNYRLTIRTGSNDYVASATLGDQDLLRREFPVAAGGPGEIHIVVKGDSALVQGSVTSKGQPAIGAQVYLISAAGVESDPKVGFGDETGHFNIAGVPPGDYRILALTGPPSAADLLSGNGQTLSLQPSEHRAVSLEVIQNGPPL